MGGDKIIQWTPVGITICRSPLEQMVTMSEDGDIYCLCSGEERYEKIMNEGMSPLERGGPMRGIRYIGSSVYAVGMKRQIYRRVDFDHWISIDTGVFSNGSEVVGFEAIDGFNEHELYAAGWEGEIWAFNGERWERKESPTNVILHDICCADDGSVYACSQLGTLVKGRGDEWQTIDTELQENIWSLAWFNDTLEGTRRPAADQRPLQIPSGIQDTPRRGGPPAQPARLPALCPAFHYPGRRKQKRYWKLSTLIQN
jgi:hypothetical protein